MFSQRTNCNEDFIRRITHRRTTTTETNDTATPTTTATTPYIKVYLRTSRASYYSSISASPTNPSLQYVSCWQPPVKDEHEPRNRQGLVYKIYCSDCRNVNYHYQQQSFSRLHPPRRSNYTIALGFFFNRSATFSPVKKDFRYAWLNVNRFSWIFVENLPYFHFTIVMMSPDTNRLRETILVNHTNHTKCWNPLNGAR